MHNFPSALRLRHSEALIVFLALSLLPSPAAFGQEGESDATGSFAQEIDELVTDLELRQKSIDELSQEFMSLANSAAAAMMEAELSQRRARFRRDLPKLVQLILAGEKAGADVKVGRAAASEILLKDAEALSARANTVGTRTFELVNVEPSGSPEEVQKARRELIESLPKNGRLYTYFVGNLDLQQQLGLDVEEATDRFSRTLQLRADFTAGALRDAKSQIDEIARRPGVAKDAEAQRELAELRARRNVIAESQRLTVRLMDKYGLDTTELRRGIILATGALSQDILDKEVATGLVKVWISDAGDWLRTNGAFLLFRFFAFLLVLLVFWILARIARGAVRRGLARSKRDISSLAKDFLITMSGRLIIFVGIMIAVAQLGVQVGPLLAGLGIAGFIIGFALQDTLSNFASGLMILAYRPFDIGDDVEVGGVRGKVDQMNLVATKVLTFDNQLLIVPNKEVWGGVIRNVTYKTTRRVDLNFGIGYAEDIGKAEELFLDILRGHDKVLEDPVPVVRLHELADSSVNFLVRPWVKTEDYWSVYWDVTREVKRRCDEEGITIPFPQRDVHIYREDGPPESSTS